jgi:hypothetical protein
MYKVLYFQRLSAALLHNVLYAAHISLNRTCGHIVRARYGSASAAWRDDGKVQVRCGARHHSGAKESARYVARGSCRRCVCVTTQHS